MLVWKGEREYIALTTSIQNSSSLLIFPKKSERKTTWLQKQANKIVGKSRNVEHDSVGIDPQTEKQPKEKGQWRNSESATFTWVIQ